MDKYKVRRCFLAKMCEYFILTNFVFTIKLCKLREYKSQILNKGLADLIVIIESLFYVCTLMETSSENKSSWSSKNLLFELLRRFLFPKARSKHCIIRCYVANMINKIVRKWLRNCDFLPP